MKDRSTFTVLPANFTTKQFVYIISLKKQGSDSDILIYSPLLHYRRGRGLITGVGRENLSNYLSEMGGAICPKMELDRPKTRQGGLHVGVQSRTFFAGKIFGLGVIYRFCVPFSNSAA